jgi:predicted GIY-YIG superfamily endonuclease
MQSPCIICSATSGRLRSLTIKGFETIVESSKRRKDFLHFKLSAEQISTYRMHHKCQLKYTDKRRIEKFVRSCGQITANDVTRVAAAVSSASACVATTDESTTELPRSSQYSDDESVNYEVQCFICGDRVNKNRTGWQKKASHVCTDSMERCVIDICSRSSTSTAADVKRRIAGVSLTAVRAVYHKKCYSSLRRLPLDSQSVPMEVEIDASPAPIVNELEERTASERDVQHLRLPAVDLAQCGSHAQYLQLIAASNNLRLVQTIGDGDCLFSAVQQSLRHRGTDTTIQQLRQVAARQLELHAHVYRPLYMVQYCDTSPMQNRQAPTFDLFVYRTEHESEWATEMTVSAMARGLDAVIRVISTAETNNRQLQAFATDYTEGVNDIHNIITVGYNAAEEHYICLLRQPDVEQVARHVSTMTSDLNTTNRDAVALSSVGVVGEQTSNDCAAIDMCEEGDISVSNPHKRSRTAFECSPEVSLVCDNGTSDVEIASSDELQNESTPPSTSFNWLVCANCRRTGIEAMPVDLVTCTEKLIRRRFALLPKNYSGQPLLCNECRVYLTRKLPRSKIWSCAWPSVVAFLLASKKYQTVRNDLWSMLPVNYRSAWNALSRPSKGCSSSDHAAFEDFTLQLKQFNSYVDSGKISDFLAAMRGYSFPCVKCPAGCYAYADECTTIQFNHFIDWKFGLRFFSGSRKFLKGARQDWPCSSVQLGVFFVNAGLVIDGDRGLCLLMCKSHGTGLTESFIHVPLNPVVGDLGFQCVDTSAAVVLTPNVIRSGRMGKWSNSTHIVEAVGGYAGISSSSLSPCITVPCNDERLSAASCLSIRYRSDIYHICREREIAFFGDDAHFKRMLNDFDERGSPSDADIAQSLKGSTFIDISDCFAVNEQIFGRDTKQATGTRPQGESSMHDGALVFVHTSNDAGCRPINVESFFSMQKQPLTGILLHLTIHCPSVQEILVRAVDRATTPFIRDFLEFAKRCAGKGRHRTKIRNANMCETKIMAELRQLAGTSSSKIDNPKCACMLLGSISTDISCNTYKAGPISHNVTIPPSAEVVIVYRSGKDANRSFFDVLPGELEQYKLMMVLGGSLGTNHVSFRWNDCFKFWDVKRVGRKVDVITFDGSEVRMPTWRIIVYARTRSLVDMNMKTELNLGGQRRMWCQVHEQYLIKQPLRCSVRCCVRNCTRSARWSCNGRGTSVCAHAVCLPHGKRLTAGSERANIFVDMEGSILSTKRAAVRESETQEMSNQAEQVLQSNSDTGSDSELDTHIFAPIYDDDEFDSTVVLPQSHSRQDVIPIFDINKQVPSHCLLNQHYNVMRRAEWQCTATAGLLQHIVSVTSSPCVSLLYPEAQLFPRIFWSAKSNSVFGAIPSFLLNCSQKPATGIATLDQHLYVRMRDGDILTSRENGYWHFVFDLRLNKALNRVPSNVVLKHGLELLYGNDVRDNFGTMTTESRFPMDEGEATKQVRELVSLLKKDKWTYFLTLTVNDMETPGVREITRAIKRAAGGDDKIERDLIDSYLPLTLRAWERFVKFLMQHLLLRNDEIVGKVKNLFYRFEFQGEGAKGNKPHVHCGVTLEKEPDSTSCARICCSSRLFHTDAFGCDYQTLLKAGIVYDEDDFRRWQAVVERVQQHDCSKTQNRCMTAINAEGEKICRYRRQTPAPLPSDAHGWFESIATPYSDDVYELLKEMGLAWKTFDSTSHSEYWAVDDRIKAGKWHYAATQDECFLSTIPMLSVICRSATNVDMCDRKFQVGYLVKHMSGKEERELVDMDGTKDIVEPRVSTTEEYAREKMTACRNILPEKDKRKPQLGREISLNEVVWFNLGFRYTYCTADFVHVPTLPLENRAAVLKVSYLSRRETGNITVEETAPVAGRISAKLPGWRRFTAKQLLHIEDYIKSPYWCDATSLFNIRPPELLFIDSLCVYCECFVTKIQKGKGGCLFSEDVSSQKWFDGLSHRVYLRSCSIDKAVEFVRRKALKGDETARTMYRSVFLPISRRDAKSWQNFVELSASRETVSVTSIVKPWDRTKFLAHLCMLMGTYHTEFGLFSTGSMKASMMNCGILNKSETVSKQQIMSLMKTYVVNDLRFYPISAKRFAKYLRAALCTLEDVLIKGIVSNHSMSFCDIFLKDEAGTQLKTKELQRRSDIINCLLEDDVMRHSVPNSLFDASLENPLSWVPTIVPAPNISQAAIAEQNAALNLCVRTIDSFLNPTCGGFKFPCLIGRAGSGKSHVLRLAVAYAVSKGLQVEVMSWTSERALKLGGSHLHSVFPFGISNSRTTFSSSLSIACMTALNKDPMKKFLIQRTDVFVFEEIGMLSAEYFAAVDNVLRAVVGSHLPWGGKLLLCCGDSKLLPPLEGRPIWASLNMSTMMDVFIFLVDVRAEDPRLRWLNSECRREFTMAEECRRFANVILESCHFVADWAKVPEMAVRLVPTKTAEVRMTDEFLRGRNTEVYRAVDEVQNGAVWEKADEPVSRRLNQNCLEHEACELYLNAILRMTYNERQRAIPFSRGQIAVLVGMPDDSVDFSERRLRLRLAPPGTRHVNVQKIPDEWPLILVGPRTTPPSVVGKYMRMGRRTQFPVRYYVCSTLHRIQGDAVPLVAIKVSVEQREYGLWQREQLAVIISRVQRCHDIIFVGSQSDTRAALERIMARRSTLDRLTDHYVSALHVAGNLERVRRSALLDLHPFRPLYRELPSSASGYVYMLASQAIADSVYIGETDDLRSCLRLHNSGYGAEETRNTALHPWGVYAFLIGFSTDMTDSEASQRRQFVDRWRAAVSLGLNVDDVYNIGVQLAEEWMWTAAESVLTAVKCGQRIPPSSSSE